MRMKIKKVFNNSVALIENENHQELVVMGKGIAFQKKPGELIDQSKIEKTFVLQNKDTSEKLNQLLQDTSEKFLEIATEIIDHAQAKLNYQINEYLYIALTDHISFAITRYKQGIDWTNPLLYEIRKYYKREFEIATEALKIIEKYTGIWLGEHEAASIALHLVNSQLSGENMELAVKMTDMVDSILNIVKYHFQMELDESSINYDRFLTHLRYFSIRFVRNEKLDDTVDDFLYEQVQKKYGEAFNCTQKIAVFLKKTYNYDLSRDEKVYLTVHIHRVTHRYQNTDKSN